MHWVNKSRNFINDFKDNGDGTITDSVTQFGISFFSTDIQNGNLSISVKASSISPNMLP